MGGDCFNPGVCCTRYLCRDMHKEDYMADYRKWEYRGGIIGGDAKKTLE